MKTIDEFEIGQDITVDVCGGRFEAKITGFQNDFNHIQIKCSGPKIETILKLDNADLTINQTGKQTCFNPCFSKNTCIHFKNNELNQELRQ
jgi:hypothetical protein